MRRFHSASQPSNEKIMEWLLTSSTVQGHQIPSSSTASALKPAVCESSIVFSVNHAFSSCNQNRFAINKAGQLVTWKAKTDTNALPFNARNRLLSV